MFRWSWMLALSLLCGMTILEPASARADAVEAIEEALANPSEAEFIETPLVEVCQYLSERHQITVLIDKKALVDEGQSQDTPVSCNLHGMTLRSILNLALAPLNLDYVIRDEALVITTKEIANSTMETKVYPVADLLSDSLDGFQADGTALAQLLTDAVEPDTWREAGGPGVMRAVAKARAIVCLHRRGVHRQIESLLDELRAAREAQAEDPQDDSTVLRVYRMPVVVTAAAAAQGFSAPLDVATTEQLAKALQTTVEPESWSGSGGSGVVSVAGNTLFVRQTPAIHARVQAALAAFAPNAAR